ncbi:MAG: putative lipase, partial [Bdellovibrionales bacterium]|nr:putative lipase [Bdellovibrionales bacterium]
MRSEQVPAGKIRLLSKLFLMVLLLASAPALATHYVVLVPGVGCTFQGCMAALASEVKKDLSQKKVAEEFRILDFHYPATPADLDAYGLARSLGQFLDHQFGGAKTILSPQDTISFVGYSQGGLVALLWLQHAYRDHAEYFSKYRPWVRNFVSLATPYWGTEVARVGAAAKKSRLKMLSDAVQFSEVQLEEMSALSHTMFRFRTKATSDEFGSLNQKIFSSVRTLAVAGSLGSAPRALQLAGLKTLDTDLTVPLPSAHPNIIFANVDVRNRSVVSESIFRRFVPVPVKVLRAVHASIPGISAPAIHEAGSGSAGVIVDHLIGKESGGNWDSSLGQPHRFQVQVTIECPSSDGLQERDVRLEFIKSWNPLSQHSGE